MAKAFLRYVLSAGVACVGIGFALHGGDARALVVAVGGSNYDVTTVTGTYDAFQATLSTQPWFADASLAEAFANAVFDGLGYTNGYRMGPYFAFEVKKISGYDFANLYFLNFPFVIQNYWRATDSASYAIAQLQPPVSSVPGPLPLFGAMAGYGMSRRLRARIKEAAPKRLVL